MVEDVTVLVAAIFCCAGVAFNYAETLPRILLHLARDKTRQKRYYKREPLLLMLKVFLSSIF